MRIPERVRKHLAGPQWGHVGSRSKDLRSTSHVTWGARVASDAEHVDVFVPLTFVGPLSENLEDNGHLVFATSQPVSCEAYQLKGKSVEVRPPTEAELAFQKEWAEMNVSALASLMPPHWIDVLKKLVNAPSMLVRFRVDDVFLQTPGPSAGTRIEADA